MLYKNNELHRLTAAEIGSIKKQFPKFPVRLTYPPSRVKPSRSRHNRLPDKPNSISFPLSATVKTNTGTESWRYCENRIIGTDGRIVWSPHNLILRGTMVLQESDIELIYWLVNFCPFLEGGKNFNGKVPKCVIEDLVGEAEKKVLREQQLTQFKTLIYSAEIGLSEKQLRQVAKAYFIRDVDEMSYAQVKLAVEHTVFKDKLNGIDKFIKLTNADQVITVKNYLQNAIDREIITFMIPKKTWAWVTENGRKNDPICVVGAATDPNDALYEYYLGDQSFASSLVAALQGKKVVKADGNKKKEPEKVEE